MVIGNRTAAADDDAAAPPFGYDELKRRAEALAAEPYSPPDATLPEWMNDLDYDNYRRIAFDGSKALLADTRFALQFFHPGFYFKQPVQISLVEDGRDQLVAFDREMFRYDGVESSGPAPEGSSFAGFRLHYPLNLTGVKDELVAFQGASYFRFLGSGQQYGLSARGLAIDTALADGEEFPRFTAFWIEHPSPDATAIRLYALLDSESVAGAYRFELEPGDASVMTVDATLFARTEIEKLGIAPLTSMFLFGEQKLRDFDDFRPEVHDSDGLLVNNGAGEWLWRPLSNTAELTVSSFIDKDPKGFGLFQRDALFADYQDLESNYHLRPSYWVEPTGAWGPGHVELVEIPSDEETNDNIVAFWVPGDRLCAGDRLSLSYRITALDAGQTPHVMARVVETFIASPQIPGDDEPPPAGARRVILDFAGERMSFDAAFIDRIRPVVEGRNCDIKIIGLRPNPEIDGARLMFDAVPTGDEAMDLRASLALDDEPVSETWLFVLRPAE